MLPGITLGVNGLFWAIPYLDPKQNGPQIVDTLRKYQVALNLFMLILYVTILVSTLGFTSGGPDYSLFGLLGNYLKLQPNHLVGIRLPWTLQMRKNWNRTHRLLGSYGYSVQF